MPERMLREAQSEAIPQSNRVLGQWESNAPTVPAGGTHVRYIHLYRSCILRKEEARFIAGGMSLQNHYDEGRGASESILQFYPGIILHSTMYCCVLRRTTWYYFVLRCIPLYYFVLLCIIGLYLFQI